MIHLICKRLLHSRPVLSNKAHGSFFSTSSLKSTSDGLNPTDPKSLTVSYLLNSCGLSLDSAISASKKLKLTSTTDQLKSVLELLKSHGLSQTHIKKMVTTRPQILLADLSKTLKPNFDSFASMGLCGSNLVKVLNRDPRILESDVNAVVEFFRGYGFNEKQISLLTMKRPNLYWYNAPKISKPKLEYFKSLGFSGAEMAQMLSSEPYILERSLENHIMPSVEVIRRVVGTNDNVLKVIKSCYRLIEYNLVEVLEPNIEILINHGVPESKILQLIMIQPRAMLLRTGQFSEVVEKVVKLGFDPKNLLFVLAIRTMATMSKSLWERKCIVLRSFGWSGDEIISAFKLLPMCMIT